MNRPVAWINPQDLLDMRDHALFGAKDYSLTVGLIEQKGDVPLYTILPEQPTKIFGPNLEELLNGAGFYRKKDWVGLTDEEIEAFDTWHDNREEEVGWVNPSEIVAHIEAKLKEKNNEQKN